MQNLTTTKLKPWKPY